MKKIIAMLMATILVIATFSGCGGNSATESNAPSSDSGTAKESSATVAPTEETQAPTTETQASTTEPYEADLDPGFYFVGYHIPAGVYTITSTSGIGNILNGTGTINSAMGEGSAVSYATTFKNAKLVDGDYLYVKQSLHVHIQSDSASTGTMKPFKNSTSQKYTLEAGNYVIGQDIEEGLYDISVVDGTGNISLSNYSFTEMLSDDKALAETASSSVKNVLMSNGLTLQISSMSVKLTPSSDCP